MKRHTEWDPGRFRMQNFHALSSWNQDVSLSQHTDVFHKQEIPPSFGAQSIYWDFIP